MSLKSIVEAGLSHLFRACLPEDLDQNDFEYILSVALDGCSLPIFEILWSRIDHNIKKLDRVSVFLDGPDKSGMNPDRMAISI